MLLLYRSSVVLAPRLSNEQDSQNERNLDDSSFPAKNNWFPIGFSVDLNPDEYRVWTQMKNFRFPVQKLSQSQSLKLLYTKYSLSAHCNAASSRADILRQYWKNYQKSVNFPQHRDAFPTPPVVAAMNATLPYDFGSLYRSYKFQWFRKKQWRNFLLFYQPYLNHIMDYHCNRYWHNFHITNSNH